MFTHDSKIKKLVVLVGLPASGKSTIAHEMAQMVGDPFVYSTDRLIERWAEDSESSYDDIFSLVIKDATRQMNSLLEKAIKEDDFIIWDQTNLSAGKRRKILSRFPAKHWLRICVDCSVSEGTRLFQQAGRTDKSIPKAVVEQMRKSYIKPTVEEGFHHVMDAEEFGEYYAHYKKSISSG